MVHLNCVQFWYIEQSQLIRKSARLEFSLMLTLVAINQPSEWVTHTGEVSQCSGKGWRDPTPVGVGARLGWAHILVTSRQDTRQVPFSFWSILDSKDISWTDWLWYWFGGFTRCWRIFLSQEGKICLSYRWLELARAFVGLNWITEMSPTKVNLWGSSLEWVYYCTFGVFMHCWCVCNVTLKYSSPV